MKSAWCFMALAVLSGCGNSDINKARDELRKTLNDGDSAKFQNERVLYMPPSREKVVCGEFNAKNLMGAYTGFNPYVVQSIDLSPSAKYQDESYVNVTCSLAKP